VSDAAAAAMGSPARVAGGEAVARFFDGRARAARLTELDGFAAAVWSLRGEVKVVIAFVVEDGAIRRVELIGDDPARLDLAVRSRRPTGAP
jgi:RNA polymerase sigma-70 factor (ECF subfamily)